MIGHLYLHIGPPKSGTTSLQYAFERIQHARFIYGGAYQPRERNQNSLANRLHHALNEDHQDAIIQIGEEISSLLAAGKHVLISEEMLLLTQEERTWPKKLVTLSNCFKDIPTTVIISLRDPAEGVPSLYQERFNGLSLRHKLSFGSFCESEKASCYDFSRVRNQLDQLGFHDIRYISFDSIYRGKISSHDLFGDRDILQMQEIPIGHANAGEKVKTDSSQRKLGGVTLKSLGRLTPIRWLIDRLGLRQASAYRQFVAGLDRVTLRPSGYRVLVMPEQSATRFHAGYLQALSILEGQQLASEQASTVRLESR